MTHSTCGNIAVITRLVREFSQDSLQAFKKDVLEQLDCSNESQFICKALIALSSKLTPETSGILKQSATNIAEKQHSSKYPSLSLHKVIQKRLYKNNDRLSQLPSDIIDNIGSYLPKRESVEFGYLNQQLYIETQKKSYLLKRWHNNSTPLNITRHKLTGLLLPETNSFAYSMPYKIVLGRLDYDRNRQILFRRAISSSWFNSLFITARNLTFNQDWLPYIPIHTLFDKTHKNNIYTLQIGNHNDNSKDEDIFWNKFSRFGNTRMIDKLRMDADKYGLNRKNIPRALRCLAPFSYHIKLIGCITFGTINEMKCVFHSQLQSIEVNSDTKIRFSRSIPCICGNENSDDDDEELENGHFSADEFRKINVIVRSNGSIIETTTPFCSLVDDLIRFKLTRAIECYNVVIGNGIINKVKGGQIKWSSFIQRLGKQCTPFDKLSPLDDIDDKSYSQIFGKLLLMSNNDVAKHLSLKKIVIWVNDNQNLKCIALILLYLFKYRAGLITLRENDIKMEIRFNVFNASKYRKETIEMKRANRNLHRIFTFKKSRKIKFSVNTKKIQCKFDTSSSELKMVGVLYHDLIFWCWRINAKCGETALKNLSLLVEFI